MTYINPKSQARLSTLLDADSILDSLTEFSDLPTSTQTPSSSPSSSPQDIEGLDEDLSLYDLVDIFYTYYLYHNNDCLLETERVYSIEQGKLKTTNTTISRFDSLRRIEGYRLGLRPFYGQSNIASHRANISLGYMDLMLNYQKLPYMSVFTDNDPAKIRIDREIFNQSKLSPQEKEEYRLLSANYPAHTSNKEISDDASDAFNKILSLSKKIAKCHDTLPLQVVRDGIAFFVHSDIDPFPEPVQAIDFILEPQTTTNPDDWNCFFVIKKLTAQEAIGHIREKTPFWNKDALRWALESAKMGRSLLDRNHYHRFMRSEDIPLCGENFTVKSFYQDKADRAVNINSYYGNMLVVEGYYKNKKGKINKVIFFPDSNYYNTKEYPAPKEDEGDVLFFRRDVFDSMSEAVTVIPIDRDELIAERQRGFAHELAPTIDILMRLDSSIANFSVLMGVPFVKNRLQGTDAQNLEDLEINFNGDMIDLGDRDFVSPPFTADLNSMVAVRNMLMQHLRNKGFLGGLDNNETTQNGRGANLANLRLIRDARVHKHLIEDFSEGLKDLYTKILSSILKNQDTDLNDNLLIQKLFFEKLIEIRGYPKEIFKYKEKDILEDTNLPFWMELEVVRNGGSHFGAAELVLYTEIKQVFGDGLSQLNLQALNRMAIKSLLGSEDARDILGDARENASLDRDQVYRAILETTSLIGSVDSGDLAFENIPVLADKDDHVSHLTQSHNTKSKEILEKLRNADFSPQALSEASEEDLESRNSLILKLAAISSHSSQHLAQLDRFGNKREDINKLKEETNSYIQASEGLLNSLQTSIRALLDKREEKRLRLMNLSPENEAEKARAEADMLKIQAQIAKDRGNLALANKIAEIKHLEHQDKQLSKARDRELKRYNDEKNRQLKLVEISQKPKQQKTESKTKKETQ